MRYLLILITVSLTACSTLWGPTTVIAKFPEVPPVLLEKCPQLKTIPTDTTVFSELTKTVTNNYTTYYECAVRQEAWVEWFTTQKKIYESIK